VTEAGLEYYVQVENQGVTRTDPPGAPASYFSKPVRLPAALASDPRPNSGSDYLEGRDIEVLVLLPIGSKFQRGGFITGGAVNRLFRSTAWMRPTSCRPA